MFAGEWIFSCSFCGGCDAERAGKLLESWKHTWQPASAPASGEDSCITTGKKVLKNCVDFFFLQFYTDRAYHLAQVKYIFMLRWRRFCRHTSVIEELYPVYKVSIEKTNKTYYFQFKYVIKMIDVFKKRFA